MFNGHYDVVPAGEGWIHPPYEAEVVGGRVYGRGASDMKSGIAAQVYAVELARRVLDDHEQIKRVAHHIVADEETVGNTNAGTGYLAEKGYLSPRRVSCVVFTEPFGVTNICIGHRGALWGHVEVQGAKSHGGFPDEGADAIRAATQCVECLYRSVHRKRRESRYPIEPPSARRPTMVVGSISGGTWANTVADRASFWYVRRLIPEEDLDVARREIQRCLHQTQKSNPGTGLINTEVYSTPSIMTRKSTCVYRALDSAIRRVTHVKPKALVSPGTFDMRFAVNQGVDAIGYGPGRLELSHTTDEWLDIAEFNASIRIMALALIQLIAKPK